MALQLEFRGLEKEGKMWVVEYLYQGKAGQKKIPSWGEANTALVKILSNTLPGEMINVTSKKNDQSGYMDWVSIERNENQSGNQAQTTKAGVSNVNTTSSRGFETPEERAAKQVYIIKQSSLGHAISILESQDKPFGVTEVTEVAESLVDWVLKTNNQPEEV